MLWTAVIVPLSLLALMLVVALSVHTRFAEPKRPYVFSALLLVPSTWWAGVFVWGVLAHGDQRGAARLAFLMAIVVIVQFYAGALEYRNMVRRSAQSSGTSRSATSWRMPLAARVALILLSLAVLVGYLRILLAK